LKSETHKSQHQLVFSNLAPITSLFVDLCNSQQENRTMRFSTIATAVALIAVSCHAFEVSRFAGSPVVMSPTMTRLTSASALQMNAADSAPPLKRNPPRRICLMVEPTPFTHVSGYANRFKEMLKFLSKAGDEVDILTVDSKTPAAELPKSFNGFKIRHTQGFTFPLYNQISLTLDLPEMKGAQMIEKFKPDLIHVTSP
jgi:sulfoquinovosyltransferase